MVMIKVLFKFKAFKLCNISLYFQYPFRYIVEEFGNAILIDLNKNKMDKYSK